MPHALTVISVCSPIESPVEGSTTDGALGTRSRGRSADRIPTRSLSERAFDTSTKTRLASCEKRTAGFDIDSTPPAIPTSARPARMESAIAPNRGRCSLRARSRLSQTVCERPRRLRLSSWMPPSLTSEGDPYGGPWRTASEGRGVAVSGGGDDVVLEIDPVRGSGPEEHRSHRESR